MQIETSTKEEKDIIIDWKHNSLNQSISHAYRGNDKIHQAS